MNERQKKPVLLLILDGWGLGPENKTNAIYTAHTPNLDTLFKKYPHSVIKAASEAVGLPPDTMGNSEVGHINIGAGRTVNQSLMKVNVSIKNGSFFTNPVLLQAIENTKSKQSDLHLMGMVSDGPVHSHISHLYALLEMAKKNGVQNVYVHAFMDGRDTKPDSGIGYMQQLIDFMHEKQIGKVATVSGRYWAMDRDTNYDRVKRAYEAMVSGLGDNYQNPIEAINASYQKGNDYFDEFIEPIVITEADGKPVATIKDNDSVIFFNFRPDRAKEMAYSFLKEDFTGFERIRKPETFFVKMTQYAADLAGNVVFEPKKLDNTLGELLAKNNIPQLRIAETEKYAHVTHFFNGASDVVFDGEDRKLIASPKDVEGKYDRKPEMSAYGVGDECLKLIAKDKYQAIILNFANCDMVGHTGVMGAAIKAVEAVDENVGKLVEAILAKDGIIMITADHGNAEEMVDENGSAVTKHSTNDVPLILVGNHLQTIALQNGTLGDIAPTMLAILGVTKPQEMTGQSLIIKK